MRASVSKNGWSFIEKNTKFGFLLGYNFISDGKGEPGLIAIKNTGKEKQFMEIFIESKEKNFKPLFRGTVPLMGHSFISAILGLVGQPKLQKYIQNKIYNTSKFTKSTSNLISSVIVSPIMLF